MKNKKVILSSVLAILMSMSMIVGGTFALFTSEDSVNVAISSGKVDIVATLENLKVYSPTEITYDWSKNLAIITDESNATKDNKTFKNGGTAVLTTDSKLEIVRMTPGDEVDVDLKLQNNSNVHIKYQIEVSATSETDLLKKLIVTFDGGDSKVEGVFNGTTIDSGWLALDANASIQNIPINLLLSLDAGADYEAAKTSLNITVRAVQGNAEVEGIKDIEQISDTEYHINTAAGLRDFAAQVNAGNNFNGKTVKLMADIDLENVAWTPIGQTGSTTFLGVFDGNGKTIKNLNVDNKMTGAFTGSGLFGWVEAYTAGQAQIKNLTIDGATVSGYGFAGVIAGYMGGQVSLIDNCHVKNAYVLGGIASGEQVGGLVGHVYTTITNSSVVDSTIAGNVNEDTYNTIDELYGWVSGATTTNNTHSNVTLINKCDLLIANAEQMFDFAQRVNEGNETFAGKTVVLAADIDLENKAWTPIGQTGATEFAGVFDGMNHTIKNLYIDSTANTGGDYSSGLFGWLEANGNEIIQVINVNVDGAVVKGNHNTGVIAGYLIGTVENCHVTNATVTCTHANNDACGDKAGVIVGIAAGANALVKDCSAANSTVTAGRDAGQIVGTCTVGKVENCTATNVTVSATGDCTGNNIKNDIIGRTN